MQDIDMGVVSSCCERFCNVWAAVMAFTTGLSLFDAPLAWFFFFAVPLRLLLRVVADMG